MFDIVLLFHEWFRSIEKNLKQTQDLHGWMNMTVLFDIQIKKINLVIFNEKKKEKNLILDLN